MQENMEKLETTKMTKETLGEKIQLNKDSGYAYTFLPTEDVKEFIKDLKDEISELLIQLGYRKSHIALNLGLKEIINKRAGKELTNE